jgi:hypothetical protein
VDYSIEACGYYTYADSANVQALEDLNRLRQEFSELGCDAPGTCAVGGWGPGPATCELTAAGAVQGKCVPDS